MSNRKCCWCDKPAEYYNDDNGKYVCFNCLLETIGVEHTDHVVCAECGEPCELDLMFTRHSEYFCSAECAVERFGHAYRLDD